MACSGSHCTNHGTGTTTCVAHRGVCSTNRPFSVSGEAGSTSGRIRADDINNVRTTIRDELARWDEKYGPYNYLQGTAYNSSTLVDNVHINELDNMIAQIIGGWTQYAQDATITALQWTNLAARYDQMRQACICNTDCACNLVCACHNDCGCNYSDERLKENIEFVETKDGVNVYSFTYLWDKATKYLGVMAQELVGTKYESALSLDKDGFYTVNYSKLPVDFVKLAA